MRNKTLSKEEALGRLEGLCARSEQCEQDLIRKMINWGINSGDRKEILDSLKENRYLDNARYAKSFANDKARFSSWGPYKIRIELARRHISSSLISDALKDVTSEIWKESLLKSAETKARTLDFTGENSRESSQKLYRFLIGRGFPSEMSLKAVKLMKKRVQDEMD